MKASPSGIWTEPRSLDCGPHRDDVGIHTMATKWIGYAKTAAGILLVELMVPGGTLLLLALFLTGGTGRIPTRLSAALPLLKLLQRP